MPTNEEIIRDTVDIARKNGFNLALDLMDAYAGTFIRSGPIFECIKKVRDGSPEYKKRQPDVQGGGDDKKK